MCWFRKKKKPNTQPKVRKESPEVIAAREYLHKTHPTLTGRDSPIAGLCGHEPFNYLGCSKNGEYTRYHFCKGLNKRVIYIVLSNKEREKIIQLFKKKTGENGNGFIYKDSLKGMFVGENVQHRFFSSGRKRVAFMSDNGEISVPPILHSEDMD